MYGAQLFQLKPAEGVELCKQNGYEAKNITFSLFNIPK